jgi:hypothetical protein
VNAVVHTAHGEARSDITNMLLIGNVTMCEGEDVQPCVLVELTHAEHASTDSPVNKYTVTVTVTVYQPVTLAHGGLLEETL